MSRHTHVDPVFASLLDALSPRYVQLAREEADDDTCPDCDGVGEIGGGFDDPTPCHRCLGTGALEPLCCSYCRASEPALCLCP